MESNASRLGIGLYGLTDIEDLDLKPALEMKTILTSVKKIKKGETVGYNNTFIAEQDMILATIPVGYYEGLDRRLSNKGWVKIQGIEVPMVGRVSMNITALDVSTIKNAKIGDEVQVISPVASDRNSLRSCAEICQTITYELVVKIPGVIKRIARY
jgi:alanine racemase